MKKSWGLKLASMFGLTTLLTGGTQCSDLAVSLYSNAGFKTTSDVQTVGDSFFDYSKPPANVCPAGASKGSPYGLYNYGGIARALYCLASDEAETNVIWHERARTNALIGAIRSAQFNPALADGAQTIIIDGGANDILKDGCTDNTVFGPRDYDKPRITTAAVLAAARAQAPGATPEDRFLHVVEHNHILGDAMAALTNSELDILVTHLAGALYSDPDNTNCAAKYDHVMTVWQGMLQDATNTDTLQDLIMVGAPYFDRTAGNAVDYTAARSLRLCRCYDKCSFVDPRVLWRSEPRGLSPEVVVDHPNKAACATSTDPAFTGQSCYPADFIWDLDSTRGHLNGQGSQLVAKLIYDKLELIDACRTPDTCD